MCCHDALTPAAAIPLTLRALGGLTTRELTDAFLVQEADGPTHQPGEGDDPCRL